MNLDKCKYCKGDGIFRRDRYTIDAEEHYPYGGEGVLHFDHPVNRFEQEIVFKLTVPIEQAGDSIVNDPPRFLGEQTLNLSGADMGEQDIFIEAIRVTTPEFDPVDTCTVVAPGVMMRVMVRPTMYARFDTYSKNFYIKLVL